ncbi:MAG: hypothetical protein ACR2JB_07920 [Bryobacteraceae bacterium]
MFLQLSLAAKVRGEIRAVVVTGVQFSVFSDEANQLTEALAPAISN